MRRKIKSGETHIIPDIVFPAIAIISLIYVLYSIGGTVG